MLPEYSNEVLKERFNSSQAYVQWSIRQEKAAITGSPYLQSRFCQPLVSHAAGISCPRLSPRRYRLTMLFAGLGYHPMHMCGKLLKQLDTWSYNKKSNILALIISLLSLSMTSFLIMSLSSSHCSKPSTARISAFVSYFDTCLVQVTVPHFRADSTYPQTHGEHSAYCSSISVTSSPPKFM